MKRDLTPWALLFAAAFISACLIFGAAGCTAAQLQADRDALAKAEALWKADQAKLKADAQKAAAILSAIAANGVPLAECTVSVVASTTAAISTGNYLGMLAGYACIVPASIQLKHDIDAGLAALPPLDVITLVQQIHASVEIIKTIAAPMLAPAPVPLPPPSLPAPLLHP